MSVSQRFANAGNREESTFTAVWTVFAGNEAGRGDIFLCPRARPESVEVQVHETSGENDKHELVSANFLYNVRKPSG